MLLEDILKDFKEILWMEMIDIIAFLPNYHQ